MLFQNLILHSGVMSKDDQQVSVYRGQGHSSSSSNIAVNLHTLVGRVEHTLCQLLSHSYQDRDVSYNSDEPWEVTEAGFHSDLEVKDQVASLEFVQSVVRESLEPLLGDFLNNNADGSEGADAGHSNGLTSKQYRARSQLGIVTPTRKMSENEGAVAQCRTSPVASCMMNSASSANLRGDGCVGSSTSEEDKRHYIRIVNCVSKLQHWAENCPYGPIRLSISEFLNSLCQSEKVPLDIAEVVREHSKTKYIPKDDVDQHNGLATVEKVYRMQEPPSCDAGVLTEDGDLMSKEEEDSPKEKRNKNNNKANQSETSLQVDKYKLYVWAFKLNSLRVPNVLYLLSYHPKYMASYLGFLESMQSVSFDPDIVSYLGIMAAARFDCSYLVKSLCATLSEDDPFVQCGLNTDAFNSFPSSSAQGDSSPLIPPKQKNMILDVKALTELNALMAHAPWKINAQLIKGLVEGSGGGSRQWPQDTLVQAIIILAHFHSLSGFTLACGVLPDNDFPVEQLQLHSPLYSSSGNSQDTFSLSPSGGGGNKPAFLTQLSNGVSGYNNEATTTITTTVGACSNGANSATANPLKGSAANWLDVSSGMAHSPNSSGGVTPSSGRATPAHFFVDDEEGADFIKQLQSMPITSENGAECQNTTFHNYIRHLNDNNQSQNSHHHHRLSSPSAFTMPPTSPERLNEKCHPADSSSASSTSCAADARAPNNPNLNFHSQNSTESSSASICSSLNSNCSQFFLKPAAISPALRKYLGVEMGHVEFGEQEQEHRIETNEESLVRMVNSMDYLLEQNGSIHLKKRAEERIKVAYNLTYNSFGKYGQAGNVNTTSFRRTIPCTCLMTHGIYYDDFNYDLIEFFTSKHGRLFIEFAKRALVEPQTITKKFYLACNPYELDHSEMVHICILVMEARMQIELYYAMKAINDYRDMEQ